MDGPQCGFLLLWFFRIWVPIEVWADYSVFAISFCLLRCILDILVCVEIWLALHGFVSKFVSKVIISRAKIASFTCMRHFSPRMGGSLLALSQNGSIDQNFCDSRAVGSAMSYRLTTYIELCFCLAKSNVVLCCDLCDFAVWNRIYFCLLKLFSFKQLLIEIRSANTIDDFFLVIRLAID